MPGNSARNTPSAGNTPMGEGGSLGGEIGTDEVQHAGGRPVEQGVDGVAMLGHGRFQSRQHRLAQARRSPPQTSVRPARPPAAAQSTPRHRRQGQRANPRSAAGPATARRARHGDGTTSPSARFTAGSGSSRAHRPASRTAARRRRSTASPGDRARRWCGSPLTHERQLSSAAPSSVAGAEPRRYSSSISRHGPWASSLPRIALTPHTTRSRMT